MAKKKALTHLRDPSTPVDFVGVMCDTSDMDVYVTSWIEDVTCVNCLISLKAKPAAWWRKHGKRLNADSEVPDKEWREKHNYRP